MGSEVAVHILGQGQPDILKPDRQVVGGGDAHAGRAARELEAADRHVVGAIEVPDVLVGGRAIDHRALAVGGADDDRRRGSAGE